MTIMFSVVYKLPRQLRPVVLSEWVVSWLNLVSEKRNVLVQCV